VAKKPSQIDYNPEDGVDYLLVSCKAAESVEYLPPDPTVIAPDGIPVAAPTPDQVRTWKVGIYAYGFHAKTETYY
jgi:hypothetical protein